MSNLNSQVETGNGQGEPKNNRNCGTYKSSNVFTNIDQQLHLFELILNIFREMSNPRGPSPGGRRLPTELILRQSQDD